MSEPRALRKINFEDALFDPASNFKQPDDVVDDSYLAWDQKITILHRWAYDAAELEVAEEEGMIGGNNVGIAPILAALHRMTGGYDPNGTAPTKHGALCGVRKQRSNRQSD